MKITKRKLRKIIRENCGMDPEPAPIDVASEVVSDEAPVLESDAPEQTLMVELEVAARSLEQVVESVQNAAHVCADCVETVAGQAPVMEAVATQAEALQEMLSAQSEMLQEGIEAQKMFDIAPLDLAVDVLPEKSPADEGG